MIALLLVALLQQVPAPDVTTTVDRDRLTVGEELTFTVRVTGGTLESVEVELPPLAGLEVVARAERTEMLGGAKPSRTTVIQYRLRATAPGRWRLGPLQVRQGTSFVQADAPDVSVGPGSANAVATGLSPRVRAILDRAKIPRLNGFAGLSLALSDDSVTVGEQVDLVTIAWIPRRLRQQMRRPPTLEPPKIPGVWNYPQPVPAGIAASRLLDGEWYDLFVLHQLVFPLAPGVVRIEPATLQFSIPVAFQFFSQEEMHSLQTEPEVLTVDDVPPDRPAEFTGAVARRLAIARTTAPDSAAVGEPVTVTVALSGEGNVTLWPAPPVRWPDGVRVYPDQIDDHTDLVDGRLTGTKTFRYLVVPDSSGRLVLPAIRYGYYEPGSRSFQLATAAASVLPVGPAGEASVARVTPPPLMLDERPPLAWRLVHRAPLPLVILLLLLGPAAGAVRFWQGRRAPVTAPPDARGDLLPGAERQLAQALKSLVPRAAELDGEGLLRSLRAAGLEDAEGKEIVALQDRIRATRFSGEGGLQRHALVEQVNRVVARLREEGAGSRRGAGVVLLLLAAVLSSTALSAQTPSAEELYQAGALRAAATGFALRTQSVPESPAAWYNLGATWFRLGDDASATAAWQHGLRLAPRNRELRLAVQLVPPPADGSGRWLGTAPVTPEELVVLAVACWLAGWGGIVVERRVRGRWLVVVVASLLIVAGAWWLRERNARPMGIVLADGSLALSPHERAPAVVTTAKGNAVRIISLDGGWYLVEDVDGHEGWIQGSRLALM
ncbi:MAG: BatD family protein [Gemmatimonadales bacterium]